MLDIETKDYDAREELLEHRKKMSVGFQIIWVFCWAFLLLIPVYLIIQIQNMDFTSIKISNIYYLMTIGIYSAPILSTIIIYFMIRQKSHEDEERYYALLLYLKKNYIEDKEKK